MSATFIALFSSFTLQGCSTLQYQRSQTKALGKYLIITGEQDNFADHRLKVIRNYSASMHGFIKSHGLPNMTYEYQSNDRDGIMLFYIEENIVFSFREDTPDPDSRYLVEHRPIHDKELGFYIYLKTGHLPNYKLSAAKKAI
ncbi:MAG: hypothetical protein JKY67_15060 [Pseudomonadales bacterium]|nr:hypothetical protein [Pseudomonadales bacterium]